MGAIGYSEELTASSRALLHHHEGLKDASWPPLPPFLRAGEISGTRTWLLTPQGLGRMRRCSERGHSLQAPAASRHKLGGAGAHASLWELGAASPCPSVWHRVPPQFFSAHVCMLRRKADLEKSLKTKRAK